MKLSKAAFKFWLDVDSRDILKANIRITNNNTNNEAKFYYYYL